MAIPQKVGLRRSGVEGNIPNASQIELGELAFNTKDGKIYFKDQEDNIYDLTDKFTQQEVEQIVGGLTTDDIVEGGNLYFTEQRSRASISSSGDISYNESSGVVSYTAPTPQEIKKGIENIPNTHFVTDIEKHRLQTDPMLIYFL